MKIATDQTEMRNDREAPTHVMFFCLFWGVKPICGPEKDKKKENRPSERTEPN